MRASNAALEVEVSALQGELALIQREAYIVQQARQYRLGTAREIPFILADDAPPLAPDAPGSAAVRLGAVTERTSPLESWLDLLFGSGEDPGEPSSPSGVASPGAAIGPKWPFAACCGRLCCPEAPQGGSPGEVWTSDDHDPG
jgi:hypothetical protein